MSHCPFTVGSVGLFPSPSRYSLSVVICLVVSFSLGMPHLPVADSAVWAAAAQIKTITPSCAYEANKRKRFMRFEDNKWGLPQFTNDGVHQ
jgi:hypothetical protein